MKSYTFLALTIWLPLVAATSNLVAVSTLPGLLCVDSQNSRCRIPHPQLLHQSSLPSLLHHLSSRTTQSDLPLVETTTAPELVILVTSQTIVNPTALIDRISTALNAASSFQATTDRDTSTTDLSGLNARPLSSVDSLSSIASADEAHILENGISEVVTIAATEEDEFLFHALRRLAEKTDKKLAVLWTTRDDTQDAAAPGSPPEKSNDGPDQQTKSTEKTMNPPEINAAQLTGLLVALLFLVIFIPGFMCLWNIQPPQSFEIFDSNDVKKKMQ